MRRAKAHNKHRLRLIGTARSDCDVSKDTESSSVFHYDFSIHVLSTEMYTQSKEEKNRFEETDNGISVRAILRVG